jgi:hypothetical protein
MWGREIDSSDPVQETMTRFCEYIRKFLGSIKGKTFLHHLSCYYILERKSALSDVLIPFLALLQHFMDSA